MRYLPIVLRYISPTIPRHVPQEPDKEKQKPCKQTTKEHKVKP